MASRHGQWPDPWAGVTDAAVSWPDIEKSPAAARRLLKDAGAEGLSFELLNRDVDQPFKYVATWLIDEWSKIGLHVTQRVVPTGLWFDIMRSGNFDVVLEANGPRCGQPAARCPEVSARLSRQRELRHYEDQKEIDLYEAMLHAADLRNSALRSRSMPCLPMVGSIL
jgi:peptide/nickel transport system substrate-binding protein